MADAVDPARQDVEQQAANELVGAEGHDLPPVGAAAAIVLVAERHSAAVEPDQAAVGDNARGLALSQRYAIV